ncbi:hypothetical protein NC651_019584 [Populus alba x Populus x berolinensis]|nr:hypothetical protein NC651_019576 [Populus alba x Populus x berolinensis]KAJ6901847.1 hypothetical protein NC651_019584 [Populus alba x Populus x berolinensis]
MISDDDHNTIDEPTGLGFSEDVSAGFKALGWITITPDNTHGDMDPFKNPLLSAFGETEKPAFIREGTWKAHHGTFDEGCEANETVKWDNRYPFHVIPMVYREMQIQTDYGGKLAQVPEEDAEFEVVLSGGLLPNWESCLSKWSVSDPVDAPRGYSEKCLNQLVKVLPGLIGESADLASSDKVYLQGSGEFLLWSQHTLWIARACNGGNFKWNRIA